MSLAALTQALLSEGRIFLSGPIQDTPGEEQATLEVLEGAFNHHRCSVAGEPIPFDKGIALACARFVARASWYLVERMDTEAELEKRLWLPLPKTPSQLLSGDLLLRYVPSLYKRARLLGPNDVLTQRLENTLRRWPLSGVLAELFDEPIGDLDFGGHRGLFLLYAERLAAHFKPAWVPSGPGLPYVELVWCELGRDLKSLKMQKEPYEHGSHDG